MHKAEVLTVLRAHEAELRRRGVARAALFGSAARGEAGAGSDLDILVEIDEAAGLDVYDYVDVTQYIAGLFHQRVDVANAAALKPHVRPSAERDAVYAF